MNFLKNQLELGLLNSKKWDQNVKLVLSEKMTSILKKTLLGQKLPYLDGISISFIPDKKSEFMELIAGRLDMVSSPENSIIDQIFDYKGDLKIDFLHEFKLIKIAILKY